MSSKVKTLVISIFIFSLFVGLRTLLGLYETQKVSELTHSIKSKQVCEDVENKLECSHHQYVLVANYFTDPLAGQEFLAEIVKQEIENKPDNARFLKDQYYIFAAELYIRSLKKRQNSLSSYLPFVKDHNIDVRVAKAFQKSMTEYSNRREVDRTIASETILQEVSNFNSSLDELTQKIDSFK